MLRSQYFLVSIYVKYHAKNTGKVYNGIKLGIYCHEDCPEVPVNRGTGEFSV